MAIYCDDPQYIQAKVIINGEIIGTYPSPVEVIKSVVPADFVPLPTVRGFHVIPVQYRNSGYSVPYYSPFGSSNIAFFPLSSSSLYAFSDGKGYYTLRTTTSERSIQPFPSGDYRITPLHGIHSNSSVSETEIKINGEIIGTYINPYISVECIAACEPDSAWDEECQDCVPACFDMFLQYLIDWNNSF